MWWCRHDSNVGLPYLRPFGAELSRYRDDLVDEVEDDGSDRNDSAIAGVVFSVVEAAAWLIGIAIVGAIASTDLESSLWLWVVLLGVPLLVAVALWLRRTRRQERVMLRPTEQS
jgi:Flp pilus assembly protein TadB